MIQCDCSFNKGFKTRPYYELLKMKFPTDVILYFRVPLLQFLPSLELVIDPDTWKYVVPSWLKKNENLTDLEVVFVNVVFV